MTGDIRASDVVTRETDAVLRDWLRAVRAVRDRSAEMSAELVAVLRDEPEHEIPFTTLWIAAVRAGAGLIDGGSLAEVNSARPVFDTDDTEWLHWLVRVSARPS